MSRMFRSITKTYNPVVGCDYQCQYCWARRMAKRQKHRCDDCYSFTPHAHVNRSVPKGERIFVCSMGDLFCQGFSNKIILQVLTSLKSHPEQTFLICSKNPARFHNFVNAIPGNCILGTTIETNRDNVVNDLSKAPLPSKRFEAIAPLDYPRKFSSIEPIMDFDLPIFLNWIKKINPELCEIGYNNYPMFKLQEPSLNKTQKLIDEIKTLDIPVLEKTVRKAWFESGDSART